MTNTNSIPSHTHQKRNAVIAGGIALLWIVLDYVVKRFFDSGAFSLGQDIAGPFLGLFRFTLVHNTGAAWGIFAGNTFLLGVFSLVMCVLLAVFLLVLEKNANLGEAIGIGLVIGGGIGNAIDRFVGSYVVDFIEFTFIQFPVFNIADIGVTCGIVLFFVSYLLTWRKDDATATNSDEEA